MSQCAFSAIDGGRAVTPQIYLTLDPGNAADLRDSYRYYVGARTQLATHPQAKVRPDLGPAAFTLTVADAHVNERVLPQRRQHRDALARPLGRTPSRSGSSVAQILALAAS